MDRQRFEHLLDAYGADFARWPAEVRQAGEAYAAAHADELAVLRAGERALDALLHTQRAPAVDAPELLAARILAAHKRQRAIDWRAVAALAACAVFGVLIGYGGGLMAPVADDEAAYFATAFEAPFAEFDEGEEG